MDPASIIASVCGALSADDQTTARALVTAAYPHVPVRPEGRRYSKQQCVEVFLRDGYVDRYSGQRLMFPGALRLLSLILPDVLPFHPNWKMEACHSMWWELYPTIDHVEPVARGGSDGPANWVCTSMLRNAAKSSWTLQELGWDLHPPGNLAEWDGMTRWCLEQVARRPEATSDIPLRQWTKVAAQFV